MEWRWLATQRSSGGYGYARYGLRRSSQKKALTGGGQRFFYLLPSKRKVGVGTRSHSAESLLLWTRSVRLQESERWLRISELAHLGFSSKFSSMVDTIMAIRSPSCSPFSLFVPFSSLNGLKLSMST